MTTDARGADSAAAWALVVSNLLIVGLVLVTEWGYLNILAIYWAETLIVGLWNLLRIFVAFLAGDPFRYVGFEGPASRLLHGLLFCGFFTLKFLAFAIAAGFVLFFVVPSAAAHVAGQEEMDGVRAAFGSMGWTVGLAVGGLFLSHGLSFVRNYLGRGEFREARALGLLFRPYLRLAALYLVIIASVFATLRWPEASASMLFVVVVVLLKALLDLAAHRREHGATE